MQPVHRLRDFVPIDELRRPDGEPRETTWTRTNRSLPATPVPAADPTPAAIASVSLEAEGWRDRVTLFGDDA